jgi:hypothetical protein
VISENQNSPSGEQEPANQRSETPAQIRDPATELEPPPPHTKCTHACKEKKHWLDYVTFGLELLGLVVLCIYAAYTIKIYCANQQAANAAHDTLGQIQQQTTLMQQQLEGTVAAVIEVTAAIHESGEGTIITGPHAVIDVMNVGQLIARNVRVSAIIKHATLPDMKQIGDEIPFQFQIPELISRKERWNEHHKSFDISPKELDLLLNTKRTIRLEINMTYNNGFGDKQRSLCYAFIGARTPTKRELIEHAAIPCEDMPEMLQSIEWEAHTFPDR